MAYKNIESKRTYQRNWCRQSAEKRNPVRRERTKTKRSLAINLLGGACKVCQLGNHEVLQIDHIKPIYRRTNFGSNGVCSGMTLYEQVIRDDDRHSTYQVLCANCHMEKTRANKEYMVIVEDAETVKANNPQRSLFDEDSQEPFVATLPESQHTTSAAIVKWYESKPQEHRPHMGASLIGHECERYIWNTWRWALKPSFPGRILRLFSSGVREESRLIEELRGIGATVWETDPDTGEQGIHGHC